MNMTRRLIFIELGSYCMSCELFVGINREVQFKEDGTISGPQEAAAIPQAAKTLIAGMLKEKEDHISLEDVLKNPFFLENL